MDKRKKILTIGLFIGLFIFINLITNFRFLYRVFYKDGEATYSRYDLAVNGDAYEITNIGKEVKVIKLVFETIPSDLVIEFTNDDFVNYQRFNNNYYRNVITENQMYVYVSLKGKINNLRITPYNGMIEEVIINPKVPYQFNFFKTLLIFGLILGAIFVLRDNSILNLKDKRQKVSCFIVIFIICLIALNYYNCNKSKGEYSFYNVYYTDALINHKLEIDAEIDENLKNAVNPYDSSNRNFNYILDASYYNGKYYCYFGVLPNMLFFVPYKLITGKYMTNAFGCLIYTILGTVATFLFYKELVKKYFKNITFRTFILSFIYIIFGSKLFWCMHRPNFYELVVIAAYFHIIFGLYLVLFNDKEKKFPEFLGYTFLASSVLCRPTALLASVFVIPKIIDKFKKYRFKVTTWLPLIIPYFVIGIITMYMNYVRFGSILDFGITYQLASNNLSAGNFSIINGLVGGFYYLFATYNIKIIPLSILSTTNYFPILTDFHVEDIGGGVLTTSFIGFVIFFIPFLIKFIKDKKLKIYLIMTSIMAFVLIFISSSIGASIGRYMLDFNYLIYFVIIVVSFNYIQNDDSKVLNKVYTFVIILSIIVNFLLSLSNIY